jgi:uncharacterized protein involved in response to NO
MPRSLLLPPVLAAHSKASFALFDKGFRPFFLLAALWALVAVPLWLLVLRGTLSTPSYLEPTALHAHEMLQGYAVAVLAGFLLTAVGNWTQRETLIGAPLLALTLLWLAGRAAMLGSSSLPSWLTAGVDLAFVPALSVALARPLLAARSRRNYVMLAILVALWLANAAVHLEALGLAPGGVARLANRAALDVLALVIAIMAARIFPSFTKNATRSDAIRSLPALDRAAVVALLLATILELLTPRAASTGVVFGAAGVLVLARAACWGGWAARRDPLLWSLHLGHGWLGLGLLLRGASWWSAPLASVATHALTVGAIGGLTLAMMARVSLGHTGRMLAAPKSMMLAFVAMNAAALLRCLAPIVTPHHYLEGLALSGLLWSFAFATFLVTYAPALVSSRVDGRPG